ncbi:transglycosylase domain-containing protein [uncultured Oscillibacter sp.]|uniref:transglycosylase domain-containing protein n=1 Tax=uncultured Oscillibacter sp. TaxID=876091 RepID=UPI00280570AA|nr:transglycosylase domain-containing protein [uncultured Oscillibacter sp.]
MEHKRQAGSREMIPRREPKQRKSTRRTGRRIAFVLGTFLLVCVCTTAMIAGLFMMYVRTTLAPTLDVNADDYTMNLSSIIYYQDRDSGEWVEYQTVYGTENRIWVDFDQMPDALWQAAVAIEDHRFFEHQGVDWKRTLGAAVNFFTQSQDTFGGSTLTQQVLKNMTQDDGNTVNRKVREIFRALEFEKHYTKWEILEFYLNTIYLGQGCYGVQTAAEFYFGKDVSELDVAECASLIAITNNPSIYGPMSTVTFKQEDGSVKTARQENKERQELILDRMAGGNEEVGVTGLDYLSPEEAEAAKAEELHFTDGTTSAEDIVSEATGGTHINSWFVDQVLRDVSADLAELYSISTKEALTRIYNSGYNIYTTLDPEIQEIAESVYEDRGSLNNLTSVSGQPIQSGITIIDPSTGNIVAMVGKMGEKKGNLEWNFATDTQQPGSSIKPLTAYAPALDAGVVSPATTFDNYPVRLLNGNPWPKNSPNTYTGWTSVRDGIRSSINTIAVQTLEKVGVTAAYNFATQNLGLSLVPEDMNVSPLGLGGLTYGLSTVEMAAAYSAFANNGVYNEPKTYVKVLANDNTTVVLENETEQRVAMKETTAYLMTSMLQNAVSNGTGGAARFSGMHIAGKTGTTNDNFDRYFVGYTPYYCAAVWVGYENNERISYSVNPAASLWRQVMEKVHADLPDKSFSRPSSGLTTVTVCADSGMLVTDACRADPRQNRVVQFEVAVGTEPKEECTLHKMVDICTEGNCLAGEFCPAESIVQQGYLDYVREDYGAGITASDNAYLISTLEKAVAPTETSPGGCPVHTSATATDPDDPNAGLDPNDPNWQPPDPNDPDASTDPGGTGNPSGGETGGGGQTTQPDPNDPTGGFGDAGGDWWSGFWDNNTGT